MKGDVQTCPECGAEFTAKRKNQRFCCRKHRDDWHNKIKLEAIRRYRKEQEEHHAE